MSLQIIQLPALNDNYMYLLHDTAEGITAVIDPAEAAPVEQALEERGWTLNQILNTHHHFDHTGGNLELKSRYACTIAGYGPDAERIPGIDHKLNDGEVVRVGQAQAQVIFIPGHTLGHIAYYFEAEKALFCGDTLFSLGCGRVFEGTAQQMKDSLQRLAALPDETRVFCGHEYTESNGRFALTVDSQNAALQTRMEEVAGLRAAGKPTVPSTMAQERAANPFLRTDSPAIRKQLALEEAGDVEVFAEIRRRKDAF